MTKRIRSYFGQYPFTLIQATAVPWMELKPIEEVRILKQWIDVLGTQAAVARKFRTKRVTVAQKLRLLSLPPVVQGQIESGLITAYHGRALLSIPSKYREKEAPKLLDRGMSSSNAIRWARYRKQELLEKEKEEAAPIVVHSQDLDPNYRHLEGQLRDILGCKVKLEQKRRGRWKNPTPSVHRGTV